MNNKDLILILLPLLLWPITFIVLKSIFIYSMLVSTFILSVISLKWRSKLIKWKGKNSLLTSVFVGLFGAAILYLIFYLGWYATLYLGINSLVGNVYSMIYAGVPKFLLVPILALIGFFEEVYWRGALQGYMRKSKIGFLKAFPWLGAALYYSAVHISTLNFVLVMSAFFVGIVASAIAERYGIVSSMITHIIWIELIVVFIPLL